MSELSVITVPTAEWHELTTAVSNIAQSVLKLTESGQKELLTITEVCEYLKIGKTSINRKIDRGLLTVVRLNGEKGKRYIKRSEIDQKINDGLIDIH